MGGYRFQPMFRVTPLDGAVSTVDLVSDLTYLHRPARITPEYVPEYENREDVNRSLRPLLIGFRVDVELRFAVGGNMADHKIIAGIVSDLMDSHKTVELSLDHGTTYRAVILRRYRGPEPFAGKTFAGAMFSIGLRCVDLIAELPAIGSGSW